MTLPVDTRYPALIQEPWAMLRGDVTWLHGRWIIYRQLFGTNASRVDLLNDSASTFTSVIQQVLLNDVQISLSKIGDPASSGKRTNLTLRTIQKILSEVGETSMANAMENPLLLFEAALEKVRHRRNKWIAHSDFDTKLGAKAVPLTGPSRNEIEQAFTALRAVMHLVEHHYTENQTAYEYFSMQADGEQLLTQLRRAERYRELVADGTIPRDDFRKRFPSGA